MSQESVKFLPNTPQPSFIALCPLFVFMGLFMSTGVYFYFQGTPSAFYQLPSVVAILPAVFCALMLSKKPLSKTFERFLVGAGQPDIMAMCFLYLIAGAFASVAQATGCVDAVVALGLNWIPAEHVVPGLFVVSCLLAMMMGSSMGTLAALAPIAFVVAQEIHLDSAIVAGAVISGAIFGDNLSFISDTTLAATRTQCCSLHEKFTENVVFASVAAVVTLCLYIVVAKGAQPIEQQEFDWIKVFPYVLMTLCAFRGMDTFLVLITGIICAAAVGLLICDDTLIDLSHDIYRGFHSMQDIFILSLLIGGLAELMREQGGVAWIRACLQKNLQQCAKQQVSQGRAQLSISAVVVCISGCVANNVVSILLASDLVSSLRKEYSISAARSACLLDIYACVVQGLLPYGAQVLLVASVFGLSPLEVVFYSWYAMILGIVTTLALSFNRATVPAFIENKSKS